MSVFRLELPERTKVVFHGHTEPVRAYYLFSDGKRVLTETLEEILVWDVESHDILTRIPSKTYLLLSDCERWLVVSDHTDSGNFCTEYLNIYAVETLREKTNADPDYRIMSDDCGMDVWFEPDRDLLWTDGECAIDMSFEAERFVRRAYHLGLTVAGLEVECISSRPSPNPDGKYNRLNCASLMLNQF